MSATRVAARPKLARTRRVELRGARRSMTPARPYEVGASRCLGLPGFVSHDGYPMRSPLVVADFLVDRLNAAAARSSKGSSSYAEVGTRDGDNVACVAQLARQSRLRVRATAVEQSPRRCRALRSRAEEQAGGRLFDVVEAQVNESSFLSTLPTADVWYYWGMYTTNLQMVRWVDDAMRARGERGTMYLGFDWHYPADRSAMVPQLRALRAAKGNRSVTLRRLYFDESQGREDIEAPDEPPPRVGSAAAEEEGTRGRPPSYTHFFAKRPGVWGVFHIVSVRLGLGTPRLPPKV